MLLFVPPRNGSRDHWPPYTINLAAAASSSPRRKQSMIVLAVRFQVRDINGLRGDPTCGVGKVRCAADDGATAWIPSRPDGSSPRVRAHGKHTSEFASNSTWAGKISGRRPTEIPSSSVPIRAKRIFLSRKFACASLTVGGMFVRGFPMPVAAAFSRNYTKYGRSKSR